MLLAETLERQMREAVNYVPVEFELILEFSEGFTDIVSSRSSITLNRSARSNFGPWEGILLAKTNSYALAYFECVGGFRFGRHRHSYPEKITIIRGGMLEAEPEGGGVVIDPRATSTDGGKLLLPGHDLHIAGNTWHNPVMVSETNQLLLEWTL